MPYGFEFIQNRGGLILNDPLLNILPAINLSWPIFIAMYSLAILLIIRALSNPKLVYDFLKMYIPLTFLRFLTIYLIPLDPPESLVSLADPITKIFYGGVEITRDLFFSGHTSTMFLIYLVLEKKSDKTFALAVVIFIATALLFQHIHYTADIVFAFPFTLLVRKITNNF